MIVLIAALVVALIVGVVKTRKYNRLATLEAAPATEIVVTRYTTPEDMYGPFTEV